MKQDLARSLGDGAITLAVGSGAISSFLAFLNSNAAGLGVLCTFFFGVIGVIFYYITWQKSTLADENKHHLDRLEGTLTGHIEKTETDFKKVASGIDSILKKLDK